MRVDGLTIALRERAPWESVDLGVALVRSHARRIVPVWLLSSGLLCAACIGIGYLLDLGWLGGVLLWWSKPLLDRIPLFVLSRAVIGETPGFRATWRAGWGWGWRQLWPWLLWRRLHPGRCVLLAMDLLERPAGAQRRQRAAVLGSQHGSPHSLLTIVGVHLETMLTFSFIALLLMFVPLEFLDDTLKAAFDALVEDPPVWMDAANTVLYWLAMALFEPFYVGAGFALYLNRRTQVEAWDVERAFRGIARRLAALPALLLAVLLLFGGSPPLQAGSDDSADAVERRALVKPSSDPAASTTVEPPVVDGDAAATLPVVEQAVTEQAEPADAGPESRPDPVSAGEAAFRAAVQGAMDDPLLSPKQDSGSWKAKNRQRRESGGAATPVWAELLIGFVSLVIENILWILFAIAVLVLAVNWRRVVGWLPQAAVVAAPPAPSSHLLDDNEPLPTDLAAAVQARWDSGERRAALALFYRGVVQAVVDRLGQALPPGATEDDVLRRARQLDSAPRNAVQAVVRHWQAAAYADRYPDRGQLVELLVQWDGVGGRA